MYICKLFIRNVPNITFFLPTPFLCRCDDQSRKARHTFCFSGGDKGDGVSVMLLDLLFWN